VAAVNEHGLRLQGQGTWLNFSKFAEVQRPQPGAQVRLQVSQGKWVKALEVLREPPQETEALTRSEAPTPDRLQIRLKALALAVALHRPPAGATEAPVFLTETTLEAATRFEAWLLRDA